MRKRMRDKYQKLLEDKRREMTAHYREELRRSRDVKGDGAEDYADYAFSSYTKEFLLSLSGMERKELRLVEEALQRIRANEYGKCVECGENISEKRLTAVPWARHCISCQELEEQGLLGVDKDEEDEDEVEEA